jgi:hypothetical protein
MAGPRLRMRQCAEPTCHYQFTATTRTPLHSTKLPISIWLRAMWLILQSDKGISSVRLAEAIGVSQPTAWRLGHAIRLLAAPVDRLDGIVEVDLMMLGGSPRKDPSDPSARKGMQGHTTKMPVAVAVERPASRDPAEEDQASKAMAVPFADQKAATLTPVLEQMTDCTTHILSDSAANIAVAAVGHIAHDSVNHSANEFVRGTVHINSAEGFNDRVRRTVVGVFHHIAQDHAQRYLDEVAWRWRQRICLGKRPRQTRKGRIVARNVWARVPAVEQMVGLLRGALGREMRRTKSGGIDVLLIDPVFTG